MLSDRVMHLLYYTLEPTSAIIEYTSVQITTAFIHLGALFEPNKWENRSVGSLRYSMWRVIIRLLSLIWAGCWVMSHKDRIAQLGKLPICNKETD